MRKLTCRPGKIALICLAGLIWAPAPLLAKETRAERCAKNLANPPTSSESQAFMNAAPYGSVTIQNENDAFGDGTDRHYTNGLRVSYVAPPCQLLGVGKFLKRITPFINQQADVRVMVAVGQNIFTPGKISGTRLIPDDRPYAGWLYGEIGLSRIHKRMRDSAVLSLGVVGPASLAKQTQRWWHGVIGIGKPEGWANQLRNEPAILFLFEREWLSRPSVIVGGLQVDFSPRAGFAVGNVFDYVAAGGMIRLGPGLKGDFGVPRIRPSLPGSGLFPAPEGGFDWYFFAGSEARLVARNIFLDGSTFRSGHSVDKKLLVLDAQAGLAVIFDWFGTPMRLSYALVFRSKEFKGQTAANAFGSISASVQF